MLRAERDVGEMTIVEGMLEKTERRKKEGWKVVEGETAADSCFTVVDLLTFDGGAGAAAVNYARR